MPIRMLHHVSVPTRNVETAAQFYQTVLGLTLMDRPGFSFGGAWLTCGDGQVHLIDHPEANFRTRPVIDTRDIHFAIAVADFDAMRAHLAGLGYREDAPETDPLRIVVGDGRATGFRQIFLLDPDLNVVEINDAAG